MSKKKEGKKGKGFLTRDGQLGRPPYHEAPELQLTRVIPNVVFPYFLDEQGVPPPFDGLSPLLWLALLCLKRRRGGHRVLE